MDLRKLWRLYRVPLFAWHLLRRGILSDYRNVIQLDRSDESCWLPIEDACIRIMERSSESDLAAVGALEALAEVNMRRRRFNDAIPQFERAIRLNEEQGAGAVRGSSHLSESYGACLFLTEDFEGARVAFERAKVLGGDVEGLDSKIRCCSERRIVAELFENG